MLYVLATFWQDEAVGKVGPCGVGSGVWAPREPLPRSSGSTSSSITLQIVLAHHVCDRQLATSRTCVDCQSTRRSETTGARCDRSPDDTRERDLRTPPPSPSDHQTLDPRPPPSDHLTLTLVRGVCRLVCLAGSATLSQLAARTRRIRLPLRLGWFDSSKRRSYSHQPSASCAPRSG